MMAFITVLLVVVGFFALSLAMERHARDTFGRKLPAAVRSVLRVAGWALLTAGLACSVREWGATIGIVVWSGVLSVVGVALSMACLPRLAGRSVARQATRKRA